MALQKILTRQEIKELYDLPKLNDEERDFLFECDESDHQYIKTLGNNVSAKIGYILQKGYFLATGNIFNINIDSQIEDAQFVNDRYFGQHRKLSNLSKHFHYANRNRLVEKYNLILPSSKTISKLTNEAKILARRDIQPRFILQEILATCINQRIIRPAYSRLQQIVADAINIETKRLSNLMYRNCEKVLRQKLDQLLESDDLFYNLTLLKRDQKDFTTREINDTVAKQQLIYEIYKESEPLIQALKISRHNISYYASLAEHHTIWNLKQFKQKNQARLYLLCYVFFRLLKMNDHLGISFKQKVSFYIDSADKYQKSRIDGVEQADMNLRKLACEVLDLNVNEQVKDSEIRAKAFEIIPRNEFKQFIKDFSKPNYNRNFYRWEHLERMSGSIKRNLRPIFKNIDVTVKKPALKEAIEYLKIHLDSNKPINPEEVPLDFFPKSAQPFIMSHHKDSDGNKHAHINMDRYEFMVYNHINKQLKSGGAFIKDSLSFRSLEDDLIEKSEWDVNKEQIVKDLNMPLLSFDIESIFNKFESTIEQKYKTVNTNIVDGTNQHIQVTKSTEGTLTKWRLPYSKKQEVQNPIYKNLPVASIAQVLNFCNDKTGFMDAFSHRQPRGAKNKPNTEVIFANTLANATGIEISKMKAISDVQGQEFESSAKNFIRHQTLVDACCLIISYLEKLPIFNQYTLTDFGILASVDGQKLSTKFNTVKSRFSKKYFGLLKGVVMYSLNANHLPLNLKVIAANEHESHYLLDIVQSQETDIDIKAVSGDMHSINRVNFALMHFFGYRFMPRFTRIEKKVTTSLIGFQPKSNYQNLLISPSEQVNKQLILDEWDNILRILASLALKNTTQFQIVRKLSSFSSNSTLNALMELDKIVMTDYLLDYIDSHEMRKNVQASLNRGEAYHQLTSAISKVSGNKTLAGKNEIQLDISAQSIKLISLCIICYNAYMLSKLYQYYKDRDLEIAKQIIRFSPVAWQHINLIGKYEFCLIDKSFNIQKLMRVMINLLDNRIKK